MAEIGSREWAIETLKAERVEEWNEWHDSQQSQGVVPAAHTNMRWRIPIDLRGADLGGADLRGANLSFIDLRAANLQGVDLGPFSPSSPRRLATPRTRTSRLRGTDLSQANLTAAQLNGARAEFCDLRLAVLDRAAADRAMLQGAGFFRTSLTGATGLDRIVNSGPCAIDVGTLEINPSLPMEFLRTCGLSDLAILTYDLRRPENVGNEDAIHRIIYKIDELVSAGPLLIGGAFISYARCDANTRFVDRLSTEFDSKGFRHWRDIKDMDAGEIEPHSLARSV